MSEIPPSRLKLHLLAERALGLGSVAVSSGGGVAKGKKSAAQVRPTTSTPSGGASPATRPAPAASAPTPPSTRATPSARPAVAAATPEPAQARMFTPAPVEFSAEVLPTEQKRVRLAQMDAGEVKGCTFCDLCKTRTHTVFGEGDVDARLMFVGEGPGADEDASGRPFVGRAGELLDKQIGAMGLAREQVFICNVVKCRPPGNRTPMPDEIAACTPYLIRQIEIVRPAAIVTLGLTATQFLLGTKTTMGKARGQWHDFRGIGVMPTYHPSYLLRNYTAEARGMVWSDLQQVMQRLGMKARAT